MFSAVLFVVMASVHLTFQATHTLTRMTTYIMGETPFPEFSYVMAFNDVPVIYYDNTLKQSVLRRFWGPDDVIDENDFPTWLNTETFHGMKQTSVVMMRHYNHTKGVHVLQEWGGCNVDYDNNRNTIFGFWAYDGEQYQQYDNIGEKLITDIPISQLVLDKLQMEAVRMIVRNVYQPVCVFGLERILQQDKNFLLRKVHPRVRVFQKTQADSGETQVICLATGFYPRHINLSLLRDERPVPEEHLTGGELLPNGDGTYQMRKSLRVSEEELQGKHRYTCTVTHLSPNNTLHVSWEPESTTDIVTISVISVLTVTALIITAAVLCWRRQKGTQKGCKLGARVQFTAAQK